MVTRIAAAPVPYPSPMFYRGGSPLYRASGIGAAATSPGTDWLSRLTGGVQNNADALIGLGTGLLSSPTFAGGLAAGGQGWMQGNQADMALQDKRAAKDKLATDTSSTKAYLRKSFPDLAQAVDSGLPLADAWNEALKRQDMTSKASTAADPADVATYKFYADQETAAGRQPKSFDEWFRGSKQAVKSGLGQPIYGKNRKTGEYVPFEPMSDGSITSLTVPGANPADYIFDPGTVASDRAAGTAFGSAQGTQQYNQPKVAQDIETELGNIDALLNNSAGLDQSFGNAGGFNIGGVGIPNQWLPTVPNTAKAGFQAQLAQVAGENFLSAYATLRGAGAITENEGQAAKEAMARLNTAQSKEDFTKALADLKAILVKGYQTMSSQTAGGPYQSTGYTPPPLAGKNYVYNPQTGELE